MFQLLHKLQNEIDPSGGNGGGGAPVADPTPAVAPAADPAPAVVNDPAPDTSAFFDTLPEDWREQSVSKLGIEDTDQQSKMLNVLGRYPSYDKFVGAFFDQHKTIKQGAHKQGLSENPTDAELSEYREANGVPAAPTDYAMPEGLVTDEVDSRIMGSIYPVAHKHNVSNAVMGDLVDAMMAGREAEIQAQTNQHGIDQQTADRQIKAAWGGDYETNKNVIRGLFNGLPEAVRDNFMSAEMADGKMVFNSPEFLVWAAEVGRQLNPSATVVPNSANPAQSINDEIKSIEDTMRNDSDKYYRDQEMQSRYRDLLDARSKMKQ